MKETKKCPPKTTPKRQWCHSIQAKLLFGMLNMAVILMAALTPAVSIVYRVRMENYYSDLALAQASITADYISGDSVMRYYQNGETDEDYASIAAFMLNIKNKMDLKYFYVVVPEENDKVYIWDVGNKGEMTAALGETEAYIKGEYEVMQKCLASSDDRSVLISDQEEYGYLASAFAPVHDREGKAVALVGVDISMDMIAGQIRQFLRLTFLITFGVMALSMVFYYFYSYKIVLKPLNKLHHAVTQLTEQKTVRSDTFDIIKTKDEFHDLSESFKSMVSELEEYVRNLGRITAEKERIGAELNVAKHIQSSLLPCIFPPFSDRKEFDIYASMDPAKEVGGDFYDFFLIDDDHLAVVIADVSGKGIPAALFMMISKTLIKSAAQSGASPKAVLEKVNGQLCEHNEAEMFVTVWLGVMEISTGNMKCVNAGHEYPAVMRKDGKFELFKDKHGFVLAGMEGARYKEYDLKLDVGDKLFLYTDGVAEATDASDRLFGTDRMLESLNRNADGSCERLLTSLRADIDAFVGEAPQFDDITMVCLERKQVEGGMKKVTVTPSLENLSVATEFFENELTQAGASMKVVAQVNVAVDEIFSNIVRYSGATSVILGCGIADGKIALSFSDNGLPYNPLEKEDPDVTLSAEEREVGGLGIFMVKKMMDEVRYEYRDRLNVLNLVKKMD